MADTATASKPDQKAPKADFKKKERKPKVEPTSKGVRVDIAGAIKVKRDEEKAKVERAKKAPIIDRIVLIKTRAQQNRIPWSMEVEKKMEASETLGQIKRLWRDYLRGLGQPESND